MNTRHISSSIICFLLFEFNLIGALAPLSTRRDWWKKSLQTATAAAVVVSTTSAASIPSAYAATATQTTTLVMGKEDMMTPKSHGTSESPVQSKLQYGVNVELADRICNYNRRFAEPAGYFESTDLIERMVSSRSEDPVTFYDSVTGKPLFVAPIGRTANEFVAESRVHGKNQNHSSNVRKHIYRASSTN
jgi:hypothetical protein